MALTEQDKIKIRVHLGYLQVSAVATFALGTPAAVETQFIVEGAMDRVLPQAEAQAREFISICDDILARKIDFLDALQVDRLGDIDIRKDAQAALEREYEFWRGKLADLLGVMVNPYEKAGGSGGINAAVIS